jgi:hypothetical protein
VMSDDHMADEAERYFSAWTDEDEAEEGEE